MAHYTYERLSALDNSFLALENPNAYMHVASTMIFEAEPLRNNRGGVDAEAYRELMESSLHLIPRYRQKLLNIPLENHPVWVDDPDFNLDYHMRHTALPRPGDSEQLKRLSARIMQQHLDRTRPLWEAWLVEGLERDRFAIITKVHHCMIDGVSGVDLMKILMSPSPEQEIPDAVPFMPRPTPSRLSLIQDEMFRRARLPLDAARGVRSLVSEVRDTRRQVGVRLRSLAGTLGTNLRRPSATPLNRPIGPHRRFDWIAMDLAEIKSVRKSMGGSLNDVVLAIVTGAVRNFLSNRQVDPSDVDFRVMAPVSVRSEDESGALGNRVSAWILELPVGEPNPRRQLELISERTQKLKESDKAVGADLLKNAVEWGASGLLALGARNVTRLLPFNLVVTNVPGPQIPLYTLGAQLLEVYPHVPLMDNLGLSVGLMSYNGKIFWGLNADYDLLPDLAEFAVGLRASFAELRRAGGPIALVTEKRATKPRRKKPDWKATVAAARPPRR